MNRRGLFGALAGGIAAAAGLRPAAVTFPPALCRLSVVMRKGTAAGKSSAAALLASGDALALPGTAPWRTTPAPWLDPVRPAVFPGFDHDGPPDGEAIGAADLSPVAAERTEAAASSAGPDPAPASAPAAPGPSLAWPGHSGAITATASLPPLAQVDALVALFGRSGEAAPAFAAALIGELVLTRLRLDAADPRRLATLRAELP